MFDHFNEIQKTQILVLIPKTFSLTVGQKNIQHKIPFLCILSDTPLSLLTETVRSMLALSDLFCEHSQFRWMFDHFNEIQKTHPIEDEMLTNLLRIGICKSIAVLGMKKHVHVLLYDIFVRYFGMISR